MPTNKKIKVPFLQLTRYLLVNHPFFAQLLVALPKQEHINADVALAISWQNEQPILYFNEEQLNRLLANEEVAVQTTLHELLHLLLGHTSHSVEESNDHLFHLVADIQVWSWLKSYYTVIPDYLQSFQSLFEEIKQFDIEYGYEKISENRRYLEMAKTIDLERFKAHQYWSKDDENIASSRWQFWWNPLRLNLPIQLLKDDLRQRLELQSKQSKSLPWRIILRRFTTNASRTYNKSSLRRPSKRYGTTPGVVRKRKQNLLIIVDTSGSVEELLLQQFFNEIQRLYHQGAQITLLQADQAIQKVDNYKGKIPEWIWGRGGTSFDPALEYANENGPFDAVVYFTDGEGAKPTVECQWPLLWVVASEGSFKLES